MHACAAPPPSALPAKAGSQQQHRALVHAAHTPYPKSQFLSQSCESVLPTSLTHILPSTRGCAPWRPAAVMGTTSRESICLPRFSRVVARAPNAAQRSALCQPWLPSLRAMRFHGVQQPPHPQVQAPPSGCQGKEKSLLGARSNVSGLGCVAACAPRAHAGMLAGFPFGAARRCLAAASYPSAFRLPLRIASPASNCCSRGTLPHFSLQSIACSFEYLLLPPRSAPEGVPRSLAAYASPRPPRPPTRSHIACTSGEVWVARLSAIHFQG